MFGKFLKHYGKNKLQDGINSLNDAIIGFDPEGASEAEIASMEENFDKINLDFSKAKTNWKNEQREADEIVKLNNQRLAAAELLGNKLDADPDNASLSTALEQLLTSLEEMSDDVEREIEEATDAKEMMDELDVTVKMYANKLKTSRADLKKASNAMAKAKMQKDRAEDRAKRSAEMAGIRKTAGGISSALESMNRQASDATASADAATRKAQLLGKTDVEENDAVAQAMREVTGASAKPTSMKDRLAALRK